MNTQQKKLSYFDCLIIFLHTCPVWGGGKFWCFLPYTLLWIALDCLVVFLECPFIDSFSIFVYWATFIIINFVIVGAMLFHQVAYIKDAIYYYLQSKKYKETKNQYPSVTKYIRVLKDKKIDIVEIAPPDGYVLWIVSHIMLLLTLTVPYISAKLSFGEWKFNLDSIDGVWSGLLEILPILFLIIFNIHILYLVFCTCLVLYTCVTWCFAERKYFCTFDFFKENYKETDLYNIDWQKYLSEIELYEKNIEQHKERVEKERWLISFKEKNQLGLRLWMEENQRVVELEYEELKIYENEIVEFQNISTSNPNGIKIYNNSSLDRNTINDKLMIETFEKKYLLLESVKGHVAFCLISKDIKDSLPTSHTKDEYDNCTVENLENIFKEENDRLIKSKQILSSTGLKIWCALNMVKWPREISSTEDYLFYERAYDNENLNELLSEFTKPGSKLYLNIQRKYITEIADFIKRSKLTELTKTSFLENLGVIVNLKLEKNSN